MDALNRLVKAITAIPGRVLRAAGWAHMEPAGLGVDTDARTDVEEIEAERRRQREVARTGVDEGEPPAS
jgi:hypothetical protein